jgi:acyl carrier protein
MSEGCADLTEATPILELGILDSFSMLKLVDWMENRYALRIDSNYFTAENFESIQTIAALVDSRRERLPGA